jgi:ribosomal protein L7/L12
MTKCPSCGEENPSGVGLCKRCGGPILLEEDARPEAAPGSLEEQLLGLLRAGKKIEAIKIFRAKTGADLKQSKDAVENLAKEHNIASSKAGCAGVLLILVGASVLIIEYLM